ncbi:outer membrane beta-barrel protein [Paraglaciecola polaris]|uniref:OmpA-like transmembrane region n=1 Tax=Paraglaciecola polaris LMG 21857 TaxID=1129793 RepID=K6YN93_9ALTE|nr:outer membrane beta-barrel protein [Paraglaciecola polaris]GAC34169.1 OmpA-like transmembrane region [Paraglaciecola polaris LMG 21857]
MKKFTLTTLAATSLLMTSGASFAAMDDNVDHHGIYVGAGYGLVDVDGDQDFDREDNAPNIYIGTQFNQYLSVEGGYIDFGEYGNDTFNTEVDGYTLGLKAGLPVNEYITLYAKGGQLWWDADLNAAGAGDSTDGDDLFYGVGASFAISQGWDVRLEYTRFELEFERDEIGILAEIDDFDSDVDYASVSVQYTF